MRKLVVEYKEGFQPSKDCIDTGKVIIMFTPDISEDYWLMRVVLYKDQSIVAFPKFGLIGVGFAIEVSNLTISSLPEILKNEKHTYKRLVENILNYPDDKEYIRTKEQFENDLQTVLLKINESI